MLQITTTNEDVICQRMMTLDSKEVRVICNLLPLLLNWDFYHFLALVVIGLWTYLERQLYLLLQVYNDR